MNHPAKWWTLDADVCNAAKQGAVHLTAPAIENQVYDSLGGYESK